MNGMFVGAFCYTDDETLLAPTGMALNAMLDTCTRYADAHNLLFNSSKTKCMFINRSCSQLDSIVRLMGRSVEFVNSVDLLGVPLYSIVTFSPEVSQYKSTNNFIIQIFTFKY